MSDLISYIEKAKSEGLKREAIYLALLNNGFSVEAINNGWYTAVELPLKEKIKKEDLNKRTINIIVIVGAVLIGAGIFSFIASNWEQMEHATKMAVIIIAMLLSYASGWYMKIYVGFSRLGSALILLGAVIYGAGIFLTAQMFHIRANWPDGFLLWMIGVIVLAYAVESLYLMFLAAPLGFVAVFSHPFAIFDGFAGHDPFLLTSSFLLLFTTAVCFAAAFDMGKRIPSEFKDYY